MHSYEDPTMSHEIDQQAEIDRLSAINAELLEALSQLLAGHDARNIQREDWVRARAAIAKATQEG